MSGEKILSVDTLTPFNNLAQVADEKRNEEMNYRIEARKIRSEQQSDSANDDDDASSNSNYNQYSSINEEPSSPILKHQSSSMIIINSQTQSWNNNQNTSSRRSHASDSLTSATINLQRSNLQELRAQYAKLEVKNRELILANNQADSELQMLRYELELCKDQLDDLEETRKSEHGKFVQLRQESSYLKMQLNAHEAQVKYLKLQLKNRDEILLERGWVPVNVESINIDDVDKCHSSSSSSIINNNDNNIPTSSFPPTSNGDGVISYPFSSMMLHSPTCQRLLKLRNTFTSSHSSKHKDPRAESFDNFINRLAQHYEELLDSSEQLSSQVLELQERVDVSLRINNLNGPTDSTNAFLSPKTAVANAETLKSTKAQVQDYKIKLSQSEQLVNSLQSDNIRLEGQVKRYRSLAETAEKGEEEAKTTQRRLQREMRNLENTIEDLKSENKVLQRKLDKFSGNKIATLPPKMSSSNNKQ